MESIKILLIDDEQSMYDILKHYCKKNGNYSIELHWHEDVPEDISHINNNNFHLLLLDYHVNQHTGLEVLEKLNADLDANDFNLPIIMLSNSMDIQIAARAIHYGISEFIPKKELSAELLNNTINNVIYKNQLKFQLIETNKKLEASNKMLLQKSEEISNFYQVISHELKTPLTSTLEFIRIMQDGLAGELTVDQEDYLAICHRNCNQLSLYINDLLDIGRLATGKYKLEKEDVELKPILVEAMNTSKVLADRKKISLILENNLNDVYINADEARIYQALLILINNAVKFSPEGETIKILTELDPERHCVAITVVDNGCGIDSEHHQKIFERLFQTNTYELGSNAGLGLGLYICKEIAQMHQGALEVESALGKGSRFKLSLPYYSPIDRMSDEKNTDSRR